MNCEHRGEFLRLHDCKSCAGNVRIKVFGCAIHRECTIEKQVYLDTPGRFMCCANCKNRRPPADYRDPSNPFVWYYDANPTLE